MKEGRVSKPKTSLSVSQKPQKGNVLNRSDGWHKGMMDLANRGTKLPVQKSASHGETKPEVGGHFKVNSPVQTKELLNRVKNAESNQEIVGIFKAFWEEFGSRQMPDSKPVSQQPKDYIRKKFGEKVVERINEEAGRLVVTGTLLEKDYRYTGLFRNQLIFDSAKPIHENKRLIRDGMEDEAWQAIKYWLPDKKFTDPEPIDRKKDDFGGEPIPPDPGHRYQYDAPKQAKHADYFEKEMGFPWQKIRLAAGVDRVVSSTAIERSNYVLILTYDQMQYLKGTGANQAFFEYEKSQGRE